MSNSLRQIGTFVGDSCSGVAYVITKINSGLRYVLINWTQPVLIILYIYLAYRLYKYLKKKATKTSKNYADLEKMLTPKSESHLDITKICIYILTGILILLLFGYLINYSNALNS